MITDLLRSLTRDAAGFGERDRDCAVVAVAIVANLPYANAHRLLTEFGRKHNEGTPFDVTQMALESLGCKLTNISQDHPKVKTPITAQRHLPRVGQYLCRVRGHIFAVTGGVVHNGRLSRKRIYQIWSIGR